MFHTSCEWHDQQSSAAKTVPPVTAQKCTESECIDQWWTSRARSYCDCCETQTSRPWSASSVHGTRGFLPPNITTSKNAMLAWYSGIVYILCTGCVKKNKTILKVHLLYVMYVRYRDHSFPPKNYANSIWHFAKFCSSLQQITVNSVRDGLKIIPTIQNTLHIVSVNC